MQIGSLGRAIYFRFDSDVFAEQDTHVTIIVSSDGHTRESIL